MNVTKTDALPAVSPSPGSAAPSAAKIAGPASPGLAAQVTQFQRAMLNPRSAFAGAATPDLGTAGNSGPGTVSQPLESVTPRNTDVDNDEARGTAQVLANPLRFDPTTALANQNSPTDLSRPGLPNELFPNGPAVSPTALPDQLGWNDRADEADEPVSDSSDETLGAAMLQSLLTQSSNAPAAGAVAAATTAPRLQSLESVVAETVSRVLVSDPLHDGRREVRIEFAREVLPDTSVRLWRAEGRLHVEFTSPPAVADSGLKEALPRLGDAIQLRHAEVTAPVVTLRLHHADTGGQPGDGRSRQRYQTQEEIEELA